MSPLTHAPALLTAVLTLSCAAATSNPDPDELKPVTAAPPPARAAAQEDSAADEQESPASPTEPWDEGRYVVGIVGEETIPLESVLSRLWMRETRAVRDVLEQMVMARLTMLEAARLGLGVEPEDVDDVLDEAYTSMRRRLAESGSAFSVDEHIRRNLQMDPGFYNRHLREDAILQLLAERCVRAWALENERTVVDLVELTPEVVEAVDEALITGTPFDEIADQNGGAERMIIVRSERNELARLAFATRIGEVGGPLLQPGAHVILRVVERLDGAEGDWSQIGPTVEASLETTPVSGLEFAQWRAVMVPRYRVDLAPFLDLVGDPGP